MASSFDPNPLPATEPCACATPAAGDELAGPCAAKLSLSREEEAVLWRMRQVHQEAQVVKRELSALHSELDVAQHEQHEQHEQLACSLQELRDTFQVLREELARANRLKLQRLGHEP